jgi:surface carbohydrate biosynthesis protein (TIGR04326 family)
LWRRSLLGPQLVEGLLAVLAFRRVFAALPEAERCVYLCEFLPWELGLNAARRGRPGPRTLGFQHGTLLGNLFNYFRDPTECSEPASPETLPLPDALAADGQLPFELLAGCRYPGLTRAEALRYQYIGPWLGRPVPAGSAETLLVAGSSNRRECEVLVALVHAAYPEAGTRRLVFRSHPLSPFGPIFARLGIDPAAAAYGEDAGDLADSLSSAALVLTAGSGVAVEALAFGCAVAVPLVSDALSMSPLDAFPGMAQAAAGPQELRAAFEAALESDRAARCEAGRAFLRRYWDLEPGLPRWKGLLAGSGSYQLP